MSRNGRARWLALALVLVWLAIGGVGGPLVGKLSQVQKNDNSSFLPANTESREVLDQIAGFVTNPSLPMLVTFSRDGGLTEADRTAITALAASLPTTPVPGSASAPNRTLADLIVSPRLAAAPSADQQAELIVVPLSAGAASDRGSDGSTSLRASVEAVRAAAQAGVPAGVATHVTGPAGYIADLVGAFAGIDGLLIGVALLVVLVILLIVYRSPILPFAVPISAVLGLAAAATIIYPLADKGSIALSGQSQGILFILVVGAATDYSLLLVSRFKEELHDTDSTVVAVRRAWRATVEPILASGTTVILGLLCLLLSPLGSTRGLGPVGALGILGAIVASLTFLPAILLLVGRRIFWPVAPRADGQHAVDRTGRRLSWRALADAVAAKPRRTWAIAALALIAAAAFLPTFKASGTTQSQTFLTAVDSAEGDKVLAAHFPAGSGSPVQIISPAAVADQVVTRLGTEPGLSDPYLGVAPGAPATPVDGKVLVQATLTAAADSPEASDIVERVRTDLHAISPDIKVGGTTAQQLDVRTTTDRDLTVIIPAIIGVVFIVLVLLLRSVVTPLLLVAANVLSFAATIGISALVFNHVFHFPGADPATPLYGFVFLVALGVDYSIFLMTRAREETIRRGPRDGMRVALALTGSVITSAGVVLAATFSALAVLPIIFLAQIAFIVAFGVLLDTLVVRSLLVPGMVIDLGRRAWWPSALAGRRGSQPASSDLS